MRPFLLSALAALVLLGTADTEAATLLRNDAGKITGIADLEVEGTLYDVVIVKDRTVRDLYGDDLGGALFLGRRDEAGLVTRAIATLFNDSGIREPDLVGSAIGATGYPILTEFANTACCGSGPFGPTVGEFREGWAGNGFWTRPLDRTNFLDVQVVPVPTALPLLATALGGLWMVRRRARA